MLSDCFQSVDLFSIGGGESKEGEESNASIASFYSQTVMWQFHVTVVVRF